MIDRHDQVLADWRRIRRYAVPRWMIERATERRLAGDWAGACAAARVRVAFDLASVAREQGAEVADALHDDLRQLAPDLLRWHLPRLGKGRSTLATHQTIVLARHAGSALQVHTPTMADGPQHLTLEFGVLKEPSDEYRHQRRQVSEWTSARHLWDARRAGELLDHHGDGRRAPFFHPDGTPLTEGELADTDDPAGLAEHVTLLQERGEIEAAYEAAGLDLHLPKLNLPAYYRVESREVMTDLPISPTRLVPEIERLGHRVGRIRIPGWRAVTVVVSLGERPRIEVVAATEVGDDPPVLPEAMWRHLPDLGLLRAGYVTPEELHPLVRSALFPARPPAEGPVGPPDPEPSGPLRVRCRGEWHLVEFRDGELRTPHSREERQRESAMRALGGSVTGCFAVQHTWHGGGGRLPRALRAQRQDLFLRAQHGDAPGVLRRLDAGADPRARDGRRRTLLHYLHMLDHEELLPRLLEAGLDLEARDQGNRTPLHMAAGDHGPESLVRALVDAGARLDTVDDHEFGLIDHINRAKRTDLTWLRDRLEQEYPDVGGVWWNPEDDDL
jgi:hypothetical protein